MPLNVLERPYLCGEVLELYGVRLRRCIMSYNHPFVRGSPFYRAYATAYQGRATITRAYLVRYLQFARSVLFVNPDYSVAEL